MRRFAMLLLALAMALIPGLLGVAVLERAADRQREIHALEQLAADRARKIEDVFSTSRLMIRITARNPALTRFQRESGTRLDKLASANRNLDDVNDALLYLHELSPDGVDKAGVVDSEGGEVARTVLGSRRPVAALSADEQSAPYFQPGIVLAPGGVHQTRPYVSSATNRPVLSTASPIPGRTALVHFEVPLTAFRTALGEPSSAAAVTVRDHIGGILARLAPDGAFAPRDALRAVQAVTPAEGDANRWTVEATALEPPPSLLGSLGTGSLGLVLGGTLLFCLALAVARARAHREEAHTDALTGLANRRSVLHRLDRAIATAEDDQPIALLMIDLDRFKELNDTLGHHAGDVLLQQVGPRLSEAVRDADTIARLGGDEFAVLLRSVPNTAVAEDVADRIRRALARPLPVEDLHVHVDASVGIALYPDHGRTAADLLQRADVAMYEAKNKRTGWATYAPDRDLHSRDRLTLLSDLRTALEHGEVVVHYQPKVDLATRRPVGAEALVRWQHPERGLVPPGDFLSMVEQTGLMHPITLYVLDAAVARCAVWRAAGHALRVSVNATVADFLDVGFPQQVDDILRRHDLPAEALEIEITETTLMSDPERVLDVLACLSEQGVRLALDDFGTGYSSLAQLKRLPVQEVKIDRTFVMGMGDDEEDAAIVRSTIDLAHNLGLQVTAEGVETAEAWEALRALGCETAQGFLIARALPAAEFDAWLRAHVLA